MPNAFRSDIQGLRAIAVALVVVFHAFPIIAPGGFIGVDVFFVVSGYVITKSLLRDVETHGLSLGPLLFRFYRKRVRRILPALSVTLIATLVAGWILLFPTDYLAVARSALYSAFGAGNIYFFWNTGYFDQAAAKQPLLHMWSLGVEEQYYLVWPVLLAAVLRIAKGRRGLIILLVGAIIALGFAYSVTVVAQDTKAAFYLPGPRAWELGVGAIVAFAPAIRWRAVSEAMGVIGLLLIGWSGMALNAEETSTGWQMLPVIIGTALLVWPRAGHWTARLLGTSGLRAIGAISFSLYLWHWPLLSFATILAVDTAAVRAAIIPLSIALATATYFAVEKPALDGRWIRFVVPLSLSGTGLVSAFAGAVVISNGAPFRFPAEIQSVLALSGYDATYRTRFPSCWLGDEMTFSEYGDECGEGQMLIWGDSHAAMLYPGLHAIFGEVAQFTRNGCLPLLGPPDNACMVGNQAIIQKIRETKPKTVVLFGAWLNHWVEWQQGWPYESAFRDTIRQLRAAGVSDITVLGPAPYWEPSLPIAVSEFWRVYGRLPDRLWPSDRPHKVADGIIRRIVEAEGATFVSVYDTLCNESGCAVHTKDSASDLITWDYGHFTWFGAEYVAKQLVSRSAFGATELP